MRNLHLVRLAAAVGAWCMLAIVGCDRGDRDTNRVGTTETTSVLVVTAPGVAPPPQTRGPKTLAQSIDVTRVDTGTTPGASVATPAHTDAGIPPPLRPDAAAPRTPVTPTTDTPPFVGTSFGSPAPRPSGFPESSFGSE